MLEPGASSVFQSKPGEYPYYGNAPADMLPYRNIEPYYRYWLERLPFRGPGRDYPDPTNLTSLKVGLLSPPPYGPEAKRGEMSRKGVMLAFDEANAAALQRSCHLKSSKRRTHPSGAAQRTSLSNSPTKRCLDSLAPSTATPLMSRSG